MTSFLLEGSSGGDSVFNIQSLEQILRGVEPGVVFYPTWLMHSIVTGDQRIGPSPFAIHESSVHAIGRERLAKIVKDKWLALPGEVPAVDTLVLLERPESEWLKSRSREQILRHYWRLLFRHRVTVEICRKLSASSANGVEVETRIERIGRSAFNEAKFVMEREHYLPPSAGADDAYAQFTAFFLELHSFQPELLPVYFPSISAGVGVLAAVTSDVNVDELLRQTRPAGAADAQDQAPSASEPSAAGHRGAAAPAAPSAALLARAERAARIGNTVRAAILRQQGAPGDVVCADAGKDLDVLVERLSAALHLSAEAAVEWRSALCHVLVPASDGWWNQEARLLYDLQKVCVNHERELYSVGVVEWLLEFGRRRLRRPQTYQRLALICKSLRSSLKRIARVRVTLAQREELSHLLHDALHHAEASLCDTVRPIVEESLKAGGLVPANAAERVAENKVVEELLDGLTHRGFITLSNVRDAIANNQLKFKDIANPKSFLSGDPLFRINRRLSDSLDGIYHRGEIYLRFFQRVSSVLFATSIGRFITLTFLLPLLGSYIIIAGVDHTLFLVGRVAVHWQTGTYDSADFSEDVAKRAEEFASVKESGKQEWHLWHLHPLMNLEHEEHSPGHGKNAAEHPAGHEEVAARHPPDHGEIILGNVTFVSLAILLLAVVNWPACRPVVWRVFVVIGRTIGFVFYKGPKWVLDLPAVHGFLHSGPFRIAMHYLFMPFLFAGLAWLMVRRHTTPHTQWIVLIVGFILADVLLNNPAGRALERAIGHWFRNLWARVTTDIIANLFSGILHFFQRLMEDLDRMIYAVDEWLRFREGQSQSSLYVKATIGIFWFYIAYLTRFAINLLVEPQLNPIKHFPVVTVSHKIILPQAHLVQSALMAHGMEKIRAGVFAGAIVTSIPGIFGFLAWELRSNWMLYRSNRSKFLKPVMIGSHGESMARLLRPGFHSGTIPKIFAHLRKAYHQSEQRGDPSIVKTAIVKYEEAIEHVGEAVSHFIERELLALLNQHPAWRETPVVLNGVELFATRVRVDLTCPALASEPMQLLFEQRGGWILAGTEHAGWSSKMSQIQSQLFGAALLGLYKMAGVDVVKEQVEHAFAPQPVAFELSSDVMTVWPDRQFANAMAFKLHDKKAPQSRRIDVEKLLLRPVAIEWEKWVKVWEPSESAAAATLPSQCVLPLAV